MSLHPTWISVGVGQLALWHRPKRQYLRDVRAQGTGADLVVVTLLHPGEGATHLGQLIQAAGALWVWLPLSFGRPPEGAESNQIVAALPTLSTHLDSEGRAYYIRARWTFDVIWPVVYTAFLALSLSWVYWRAFAPASRWQWANLVPLAGMLFDCLENSPASLVMARYPDLTPGVAHLAPLFTLLKWLFVTGSFVLLFIGGGVAVWHRAPAPAAGLRCGIKLQQGQHRHPPPRADEILNLPAGAVAEKSCQIKC